MRMLKKFIRKLYHLIWFLSVFLIFTPGVFAEMPTGEQYSEFATHRVQLMEVYTYYTGVYLYGYDYAGHQPSLSSFLTGSNSLVRYENGTNDQYSNWGIRLFQSYHSTGTYTVSWRTAWNSVQNAGQFCNDLGSIGYTGGTVNSQSCSVSGNMAFVIFNVTITSADTGTSRISFTGSMSINWFMRLATASYYPQYDVSEKIIDTGRLEQQNQTVINQNQTIIEQNRQQIQNDNQNAQNIIDANRYDSQQIQGAVEDTNDTLKDETAPTLDLSDLEVSSNTPISDLITMPLTILNTLIQTLDGSCTNYTIPFFNNNSLTFPCFTISDYLGSTVTNYIDLFICFYMCYNIAMLIVSVFEDVTSLRDIYDSMYVPKHAESGYQPKHAKGGGN